jgi:sugar O-acyltransferase (sialic acid O-acetyltransferase NeuD family)
MTDLAIVGAGGHGFVVAEAASLMGKWSRITFYDDSMSSSLELGQFALLGSVESLRRRLASASPPDVVVAIGRNRLRFDLTQAMTSVGATLATVVHPSAVISPSAVIGAGSVALAGSVINGRSIIGTACIINTRASVDHDCRIGNGVHVSPGAALAGGVSVGEQSWICIGASVIQGLKIGSRACVAAGAVVLSDVMDDSLVTGCPAVSMQRRPDRLP